jgi:hypothetical protein
MLVGFRDPGGLTGYVAAEEVLFLAPAIDSNTKAPVFGACVMKLRGGDVVMVAESAGEMGEKVNAALGAKERPSVLNPKDFA